MLFSFPFLHGVCRCSSKKDPSAKNVLGIFLIWVLALAGGVRMVKFYGHIFEPNVYADFLEWTPEAAQHHLLIAYNNVKKNSSEVMICWFEMVGMC